MNLFLSLSFSLFVLLSLARHDFRKITRAAIGLNPERIVGTCTGPCGRYVYKGEPGAMCFECRQLPLEEVQRIEKEKKEAEEQRARDEAAAVKEAARVKAARSMAGKPVRVQFGSEVESEGKAWADDEKEGKDRGEGGAGGAGGAGGGGRRGKGGRGKGKDEKDKVAKRAKKDGGLVEDGEDGGGGDSAKAAGPTNPAKKQKIKTEAPPPSRCAVQ